MLGLDIGPGIFPLRPFDKWYTLDVRARGIGFRRGANEMRDGWHLGMDRVGEWGGAQALPFPGNSFDVIHASHVLEHIPWTRSEHALRQAYSLLKPGGVLEIHVPDLDALITHYQHRRAAGNYRPMGANEDPVLAFNSRMYAHGPDAGDWHKAAFDYRYLKGLLERVGFTNLRSPVPVRGHNHGILDLSISGVRA